MRPQRQATRATTLVELMVAMGILAMIMTAVISFYVEAIAVSHKRDLQSDRLRRFHLGLDKMEQALREGRLVQMTPFKVTFLHLTDIAEQNGFPNYSPTPMQFVSLVDGVHQIFGNEDRIILPFKGGERLVFGWIQENPPADASRTLLSIELYYSGKEDGRSDLLFRRTINLDTYFGSP